MDVFDYIEYDFWEETPLKDLWDNMTRFNACGEEIVIQEMSTQHLINTRDFLQQEGIMEEYLVEYGRIKYELLKREYNRRFTL